MSPLLVLLLIGALVLVGVGLQVSAHQIQRFPVDTSSAGPLIDTTTERRFVVRPSELENLHSIVEGSLSSKAVAAGKLQPLLQRLDTDAPQARTTAPAPSTSRKRSRARWLEQELADLEQRWGLSQDHS